MREKLTSKQVPYKLRTTDSISSEIDEGFYELMSHETQSSTSYDKPWSKKVKSTDLQSDLLEVFRKKLCDI